MSRKTALNLSLFLLLILSICFLVGMTSYFTRLPQTLSQHETIVLGQNKFVPGSQAAVRVLVRDSRDASPLSDAEVQVFMQPAGGGRSISVYSGRTNGDGTAMVSFKVPQVDSPDQVMRIQTKSRLGSDEIERPVSLKRDYRVLLTTDKPLYQPGQLIHVRSLALSTFDLVPAAGQPLEIVIADGKGNKVFRQKLTTTDFGVAYADFQLASEVNTGAYKITATLGNVTSEKTVNVEHYVLPKFSVKLNTEKPYYQPGQHVRGSLEAGYFFGKPVAGGQVKLEGYSFDVERAVTFNLQGVTGENGEFEFEFDLPAYLAGSDLEGGMGRFYLQAVVTDLAQHSETSNLSLPVAQNGLVIEAIPEGGSFRSGVDNILYVLTSYPDGSPAETDLSLTFYENGQSITARTGPYGLAEVHLTPQSPAQQFMVEAHDLHGNAARREFVYQSDWSEEAVLLRPDKPVYRVGETMDLMVLTSKPSGTVYLDIIRQGQTVSTRSVEVKGGHAEVAVDLTPDLYGTIQLNAYKVLSSGNITRDTRLVVVDNAQDLDVTITPGKETYRPGDQAGLDLQVSNGNGTGVHSAIGLAIVDESVFSLAEQEPGFARLYFMLEQELLVPRYDLHGFSIPQLIEGVPAETVPEEHTVQGAAQASLAAATPQNISFSLQANSHVDAMQRAYDLQRDYFSKLGAGLYVGFLGVSLLLMGLSLFAAWRQKKLAASVLLALILVGALVVLVANLPLPKDAWWAGSNRVESLSYYTGLLTQSVNHWLPILGLLALVAYLGLLAFAWRQRDAVLGWSLVLLIVAGVMMALFGYAATNGGGFLSGNKVFGILTALVLLPFAFLTRFSTYSLGRKALPALASLVLVIIMLLAASASMAIGSPMLASMANRGGFVVEDAMIQKGVFEVGGLAPLAALPAPAPTQAAAAIEAPKRQASQANLSANTPEPPRLRQYFPETMLWMPDAVTDANGALHLDVPVADSITTWRVTALASSQDGRLGSASVGLRAFQDFFIDLDLPQALTVGDEVSIPVGIFNYLSEPQDVRLELTPADWFELRDESVKQVSIPANDISVVYFRVKAIQFGQGPFKVAALGTRMSDAIQKEVRVFPNGKQIHYTQSDRLVPGTPVRQVVKVPVEAIPGTQSLMVKVYPGVLSQVVEGLDGILRMPNGCFEQTSSTTYPNVLVLDYLKSTGQASPEVQLKAEEYINLGYQRLTTFEVQGSGGFSLFGEPPADRMLTAYGLQEFSDMSRVSEVDPALVQRAAEWLLGQQTGDGSWENDRGLVHENTWASLGDDRLPVTAYIAWSLIQAGYGDDPRTQKGINYLREKQVGAQDPYVVALITNALVAADQSSGEMLDGSTQAVLDRLAGMAVQEGNGAYWQSQVATFMGSEGKTGSLETTALAALALLKAGSHPELANSALTYLIQQKDSFGTWYSTQATVLSLKALIQSVRAGSESVDATVNVSLNGGQTRSIQVNKENFDVVQLLSFADVKPGADNVVEIQVQGQGNLMYQFSGSYYLPWDKLAVAPEEASGQELVKIDVAYDRKELAVNDSVGVNVTVSLNEGQAESALIDLGVPPGFSVQAEDLDALIAHFKDLPPDYAFPKIERYELTGRQILVYVSNLSAGHSLQFSYHLRAKYPLQAQTPASSAYDYYNPDVNGESVPQLLLVKP